MKIEKVTNSNIKQLKSYLNKLVKEADKWNEDEKRYTRQFVLKHVSEGAEYVIIWDNNNAQEIAAYAYIEMVFDNIMIISPSNKNDIVLECLKTNYPNSFVRGGEWDYNKFVSAGYIPVEAKSSIHEVNIYQNIRNEYLYAANPNIVTLIRDEYEKRYLPVVENTLDLTFKVLTATELNDYLKGFAYQTFHCPIWKKDSGNYMIAGFHYFQQLDSFNLSSDMLYLVAMYGDIIVGLIKFGPYAMTKNGWIVSYIDVSEQNWEKGIATMLFKELPKYLPKNIPLYVTKESDMGKACHMLDICQRENRGREILVL